MRYKYYITKSGGKMNQKLKSVSLALLTVTSLSGCASYRTSSNIEQGSSSQTVATRQVEIFLAGSSPGRPHAELQRVEVSVKKLTVFHKDPTREQANEALSEKAALIGADAVKDVQYQSGVGLTTWGYMDAQGTAIKFK